MNSLRGLAVVLVALALCLAHLSAAQESGENGNQNRMSEESPNLNEISNNELDNRRRDRRPNDRQDNDDDNRRRDRDDEDQRRRRNRDRFNDDDEDDYNENRRDNNRRYNRDRRDRNWGRGRRGGYDGGYGRYGRQYSYRGRQDQYQDRIRSYPGEYHHGQVQELPNSQVMIRKNGFESRPQLARETTDGKANKLDHLTS